MYIFPLRIYPFLSRATPSGPLRMAKQRLKSGALMPSFWDGGLTGKKDG